VDADLIARALVVAERIAADKTALPLARRTMDHHAAVLRGELPLEGMELGGLLAQVAVTRLVVDSKERTSDEPE